MTHRQTEKIVDASSDCLRLASDHPVGSGKTPCRARSTSARAAPVTVRHNSLRSRASASARTVARPPSHRIDEEPVAARWATTRVNSIGSVSPAWPCHSVTREVSGQESHGSAEPRDRTWVWPCGGRCHPSARMLDAPTTSASQPRRMRRRSSRSSRLVRSVDVPDGPAVAPELFATRFARTQNLAGHAYGLVTSSRVTIPNASR